MPTTLDCFVMRNVFGSGRMREVFDSRRLLQGWLDVWAAFAEAQADAGLIPAEAATAIRAAARAENFDLEKIGAGVEEGRHILMPAIRGLTEASGEAGKYVHWGTTTQDIIDTGLLLQCRDALQVIDEDVRDLIGLCAPIARDHRDLAMAGRTHWQHAVPITFGMKIALWVDELARDLARLERCRDEVLVAQLFGAGGTMAALGEHAAAVQEAFSRRIGLRQVSVPWFNQRDRFAELVSCIGILAATVERICTEIARLSLTEISEVAEPRTNVQVGSSTMPQKHNPINSERAAATCKMIRGLVPVMQGLDGHLARARHVGDDGRVAAHPAVHDHDRRGAADDTAHRRGPGDPARPHHAQPRADRWRHRRRGGHVRSRRAPRQGGRARTDDAARP